MFKHALPHQQVLEELDTSTTGLSSAEASQRLDRYGPNRLPAAKRQSALVRLGLQFHNPLIYLLLAAAVITFLLAHYVDAGVILGVVLVNAGIGFVQEGKAQRALEAVSAMLATRALVLRDGERHEIDAANLVPGDIVLLESGTRVAADLRLFQARNLHITEAALTGESIPSRKTTDPVAEQAPVGDRECMAYSGTTVASGQGRGIVVATGVETELGRIGTLVSQVGSLSTPLTRRLDQFARQISLFVLGVGLLTFLYGYFMLAMDPVEIFLAVVGLAVAAIPEGLPAIVTITLAIGTSAMAKQRAILRRLPAVETLGSVSVICSDKTGTLTRNEMTVVQVMLPAQDLEVTGAGYAIEGGFRREGEPWEPANDSDLMRLGRCALLCNDAELHRASADETEDRKEPEGDWTLVGDPTEGALLTLAMKSGLDAAETRGAYPRVDEIPFESDRRYMATLHHDHQGGAFILIKGAAERILELCETDLQGRPIETDAWLGRLHAAASQGQRVLTLAERQLDDTPGSISFEDIRPGFRLLGMVGIIDPPRPEAIEAVAECQQAGIRTLMITGDHADTASAIGGALCLRIGRPLTGAEIETLDEAALRLRSGETDIVARASPEHKLRLVSALQAQGLQVAMTGDGVNDAPALKAADIGCAMGDRGTDAAKEAADLVLTDDNFATIASAVRQGRNVFDNIKKSLLFILPTNGGEAGIILLAVFAGMAALPVTAAQILWINMITAITLALALAFEPAEPGAMRRPPRPASEPLITRLLLVRILYVSFLMIAVALIVFQWELARGSSIETARTAVVNMLVFGELVYLFNVRHFTASAMNWETLVGNRVAFWVALALIGIQLSFTYAPPLQFLFQTTALDWQSWTLILGLSLLKFLAVEAEKGVLRRFGVQRL